MSLFARRLVTLMGLFGIAVSCQAQLAAGEQDVQDASLSSGEIHDPWEPFNRRVHRFNERADDYLLRPAAQGYRAVTASWMRRSVRSFFSNLDDFRSGVHGVLQWQWRDAGHNFGRFGVNTTLGVAGLFDVASNLELDRHPQDLGLTLGHWGVGEGPYLVLPFLGPSTVRDGLAIYPDTFLRPERYLFSEVSAETAYGISALYVLSLRESLLDLERGLSGDRYILMRDFYLSSRRPRDADDDFGFGEDLDDWDDDDW